MGRHHREYNIFCETENIDFVICYFRTAFSKNGLPTIIPIPDPNVIFGKATKMSQDDITRLNTLYQCCEYFLKVAHF